jgi:hypothetical protein
MALPHAGEWTAKGGDQGGRTTGQTRATRRWSVATAWLFAAIAGAAGAAPTDLDSRWGGDGMVFPSDPVSRVVEGMLLQADGSLIVALSGTSGLDGVNRVIRLEATGRLDRSFGSGGQILLSLAAYAGIPPHSPKSIALHRDGRIDVLWVEDRPLTPSLTSCVRVLARYLASGQPDHSFGQGGWVDATTTMSAVCCWGLELDSAGNSYRIERASYPTVGVSSSSISVRARDGTPLPGLAPFDNSKWSYASLKVDSQDRLVVGLSPRQGTSSGPAVGRVGAGTFGTDGIAAVSVTGPSVLPLLRGGVIAFGGASITRLTESGTLDRSFGIEGVVNILFAKPAGFDGVVQASQVAELPDGRLLVAAEVYGTLGGTSPMSFLAFARLLPDGNPDPTFADDVVVPLQTGWQARLQGKLLPSPTGEFLVGAQAFGRDAAAPAVEATVLRFLGGELSLPYPWPEGQVVEYLHAGYGHYFMTADETEIATLDRAPGSGWARTGKTFSAYVTGPAPLVPVCRFWSDQTFAPKSSHFYTPFANECAKVKRDPAWLFEREAFHLRLPEGLLGARTCPAGTQPLFRAYNDGKGGAPNHRYTTDPAVLDAMIAQGWIMEGEAATRVFACVPLRQ